MWAADRWRLWRWIFATTLIVALWVAVSPTSGGSDWFPQADKARHAAAFVVLWLIGTRARLAPSWALALGLLAFGLSVEIAQSFTATRQASFADLLADGVGIALGWMLRRPEPLPAAATAAAPGG